MSATWADFLYSHYVIRSDGAKWQDGARDDQVDTTWFSADGAKVTLGPGLYDELMIVPYLASEAEIKAWYRLQAPFYDASPHIDASAQPITAAGGSVKIDHTGAWGYSPDGVRRAGFGTDGRWIAGGGNVYADETGLYVGSKQVTGGGGSITEIEGAHDFDLVPGQAASGSVHIGPGGITVNDGKIDITSTDGRTKFLGDRWEIRDDNDVLRVRIGRLD